LVVGPRAQAHTREKAVGLIFVWINEEWMSGCGPSVVLGAGPCELGKTVAGCSLMWVGCEF
jgi:hypothetical protein